MKTLQLQPPSKPTMFDINHISFKNKKAWWLIQQGLTCGVFQLESNLGQFWAQKIKPSNIDELSALISLIRPASLESGMTEKYCAIKNGEQSPEGFGDPDVDSILKITNYQMCIHEDAEILLDNGCTIPIKDLTPAHKVQSVNLDNNQITSNSVLGVIPSRQEKGVTLTLSNGYQLDLTVDHKVWTQRGWVEAQDLSTFDLVSIPQNTLHGNTESIMGWLGKDEPIAYLLGQLVGDGQLSSCGSQLCVGSKENAFIIANWINQSLPKLKTRIYHHTRCWYISISCPELAKLDSYGCRKTKWHLCLELMGMKVSCKRKRIPLEIMSANPDIKAAFIAGLFDSDGCATTDSKKRAVRTITTASSGLRQDIASVLTSLGIDHFISNNIRIVILDTFKFDQLINKFTLIKDTPGRHRGQRMNSRTGAWLASLARQHVLTRYGSVAAFRGHNHIRVGAIEGLKESFITRCTAEKCGIDFGDLTFVRIKHIKPHKTKQQFYSISVDVDHNFISNGILVKNCYQEQLMKFGSLIAWKHLPEMEMLVLVDKLRKGVGKKDSKLIAKLREGFVNGCKANGKTEELAHQLFDVIEKAGRYAFNAAHAFKYAHWAYKTAYLKANYPLEFYAAYLSYSKFKPKPHWEIRSLIYEARVLGIHIAAPNIMEQNREFKILNRDSKKIGYGLVHIKNVGHKDLDIIETVLIDNWTTLFMNHFKQEPKDPNPKLRSRCVESLILSGACDIYGIPRQVLLNVFRTLRNLTAREQVFVINNLSKLDSIYELPGLLEECARVICNKTRREIVVSEAKQLDLNKQDSFTWKSAQEKELLGLAMTCSAVDDKMVMVEKTCLDCRRLVDNNNIRVVVHVVLDEIKVLKTKRGANPGQKMAILDVSDKTGTLRVACFPKEFISLQDKLHTTLVYTMEIEGNGKNNWCLKSAHQQ
jgi:hypothetical protein